MLFLVASCKKDDTTTPAKPKKDILISKTWLMNEALVSGISVYKKGGTSIDPKYNFAKVRLNFKADGTLTGFDNNGTAISKGTWILSADETKLTISNTGIIGVDGDQTVLQITATNFDIKGKVLYQGALVDATVKAIPE